MDSDTELCIYTKSTAEKISLIKKDFKKKKVDLFAIMHLLNYYVLGAQDPFGMGIADDKLGADIPPPVEPDVQSVKVSARTSRAPRTPQ